MTSPAIQSPPKSPKKKATKATGRSESPAPSSVSSPTEINGDDQAFESPYIRELQKNIRNINKKIANASKTDAILEKAPGKSLDQLVASRIINVDQKAQILKKPVLQAQLAQYEELLAQYLKVNEQYRRQAEKDKAEKEDAIAKAKVDAIADAKAKFDKDQRQNLLVISQFLRLAAYRREEGTDPESDETQAVEGVLLAIYTGDEGAVSAMLKLVEGSSEQVLSVPGEQLQTTYTQVKALAQEYKTPLDADAAAEVEAGAEVGTDPTVANATVNEIEAEKAPAVNGHAVEAMTNGMSNVNVSDDAANAVAESHWDTKKEGSISNEWVQVPRDPKETDTGLNATPADSGNTQSWADDHPEPETKAPADPNDGFHQVQRNHRNNRDGGHRGGRGRGGHRGDGRGRGRGNRNGGGSGRGARRGGGGES